MRNREVVAELRALRTDMDARFDRVTSEMNARFEAMHARFEAVNGRFDAVNDRMDTVNGRLDQVIDAIADLRSDFDRHTHD